MAHVIELTAMVPLHELEPGMQFEPHETAPVPHKVQVITGLDPAVYAPT